MGMEANGEATQRYLLYVWGCVDPELHGPYATDEERIEAARALASDTDGVFRLNAVGPVEVESFGAWEIEEEVPA